MTKHPTIALADNLRQYAERPGITVSLRDCLLAGGGRLERLHTLALELTQVLDATGYRQDLVRRAFELVGPQPRKARKGKETTMTRTETMQTNELTVVQVSARGAEIGVNGTNRWITWAQLREAASQPIYGPAGCQGGQPDAELRQVYAGLLRRARVMLRQLPRRDQGIEVRVFTRTGGATWVAEVYDGSGEHRRDLMHADEGLDEPRGHLAVSTGRKIARRLGASLRIC